MGSDDLSDDSSDDITESDVRQPKAKRIKWIKQKFEEEFDEIPLDLELALDCLESSHVLLEVFQYQKPMIHLIKPTILNFARDSFIEITPAKNLKHRDGRLMGGDSLKNITLETKQEKEERIVKDKETDKKIKLFEIEKEKLEVQLEETESGREKLALKRCVDKVKKELKKLENGLSSGKFATLCESEELTLSQSLREIINKLT